MGDFFFNALVGAAAAAKAEPFLLTVAVTADNLQYGVTPYWNTGGGCEIEWGDGDAVTAATSGTTIRHAYAAAGTYRVAVTGDMYRFLCNAANPGAVTFCNGNWAALGNITNGNSMFYNCANLAAVDISGFRTPNVTSMAYMFCGCSSLTTIYTGNWDTGNVTNSSLMFTNCTNLVGGAGTKFNANYTDKTYARIDGGTSKPGYFTYKIPAKKGDVNDDGSVDVADIAAIIDKMAGSTIVSAAAADVNGDGSVDVADIAAVIDTMAANARRMAGTTGL